MTMPLQKNFAGGAASLSERVLPSRAEVAALVALAARTVAPLWPLESAIAVNPLAGYEDLPFETAVARAAQRFGARETLPLAAWRRLLQAGRIDAGALREAAIAVLGGLEAAFSPIGPDLLPLDLLMARLIDLPVAAPEASPALTGAQAFIAKWCAAFLDQGGASSAMPHRDLGLYRAVLALAAHDRDFHRLTGAAGQRLLLSVPRDPFDAIAEAIVEWDLPAGAEVDRLADLVARLPGWAGHIRWRCDHADPADSAGAPATMADLIALWTVLERALPARAQPESAQAESGQPESGQPESGQAGPKSWVAPALAAHFGLAPHTLATLDPAQRARMHGIATMPESALGALYMTAAERGYRDDLVPRLSAAARKAPPAATPAAQLVFCIDVRSEPFRRALEAQGAYETLGYAGFFGLPIARHRHGAAESGAAPRDRLLPVLLAPQHTLHEAPAPGHEAAAHRAQAAAARSAWTGTLFGRAKQGLATAFATAEATGPLAGALMLARTFAPRLASRMAAAITPSADPVTVPDLGGFTLSEKLGYGALLFRLTGLRAETAARLVVLAGHAGGAVNNPYAAALDCGACGGHPGGFNARVLAAMLNDPHVRGGLAAQGLALPETTRFMAAEHNTTTDAVTLFDRDALPASHRADLAALEAALARAGAANRERRAAQLGRSADDLLTGAVHWGEVRPEWGLAGNAAFVVGPRWLTADADLGGRAFLHSYDWRSDPEGQILAMILTAPMVVAQWINCQYLFSTIDNDRYGAGDKTTQNAIGRIGVVQGNGGDLCVGLPRQSLFADHGAAVSGPAGTPWHIPQRLLTVVHAPFDRVEAVIAANPVLMRLFGNAWVHLVVIDPASGKALRRASDAEMLPRAGNENPSPTQEKRP